MAGCRWHAFTACTSIPPCWPCALCSPDWPASASPAHSAFRRPRSWWTASSAPTRTLASASSWRRPGTASPSSAPPGSCSPGPGPPPRAPSTNVRAARGWSPRRRTGYADQAGRGMRSLLERTVPGCDQAVDQARYRRHHPTVMRPLTRLLPGAAELLAELKRLGKGIAVCSNKPRAFTQELLDYLDVGSLIDAVLGPEDVVRAKPAPDMLLAGLQRLAVKPSESLYVGDMVVDIETARAAGVAVWVVATGSDERAALETAGPDRVYDNLGAVM